MQFGRMKVKEVRLEKEYEDCTKELKLLSQVIRDISWEERDLSERYSYRNIFIKIDLELEEEQQFIKSYNNIVSKAKKIIS